ncbi:MAG: hypothetical protein RJB13_1605 [Pseudomonadota bacterium]|jgi:hypothetical protein
MRKKRAKVNKVLHLWQILLIALSPMGCVTPPPTSEGLQKDFEALSPARIAAFPPVLLPHPSSALTIDPATLMTYDIKASVESKILSAFKNQPGVNGISFNAVRAALKNNPKLIETIDSEIRKTAQLTSNNLTREYLLLSKACQQHQNLLGFYKFCVTESPNWQTLLNQFSASVYNSDTVLLPFITAVEKKLEQESYVIRFGVSVLLIDTNTGKLMWGRDRVEQIAMPSDKKQFAEVKTIIDAAFSEQFWADFPGRRSVSPQAKE